MAKGIPVAATRIGAVPDLIEDGVHGALCAADDPSALAGALLRVLGASLAQRQNWGLCARQKAERDYGYDGWAAAHERLYERVLGA
jgi:glycosyltransferase involved in cell wall biosynthesis